MSDDGSDSGFATVPGRQNTARPKRSWKASSKQYREKRRAKQEMLEAEVADLKKAKADLATRAAALEAEKKFLSDLLTSVQRHHRPAPIKSADPDSSRLAKIEATLARLMGSVSQGAPSLLPNLDNQPTVAEKQLAKDIEYYFPNPQHYFPNPQPSNFINPPPQQSNKFNLNPLDFDLLSAPVSPENQLTVPASPELPNLWDSVPELPMDTSMSFTVDPSLFEAAV